MSRPIARLGFSSEAAAIAVAAQITGGNVYALGPGLLVTAPQGHTLRASVERTGPAWLVVVVAELRKLPVGPS